MKKTFLAAALVALALTAGCRTTTTYVYPDGTRKVVVEEAPPVVIYEMYPTGYGYSYYPPVIQHYERVIQTPAEPRRRPDDRGRHHHYRPRESQPPPDIKPPPMPPPAPPPPPPPSPRRGGPPSRPHG